MRGGNDDTTARTTSVDADKVGLDHFQEQIASTADLLQNYRELDGKNDKELIKDITDNLVKDMAEGKGDSIGGLAWTAVALVHGAEAASGKILAAFGEFSINSALFLSFIVPYLFEPPEAVGNSDWAKVPFNCCMWISMTAFMIVIISMIYINHICNTWTREIDLIHTLYRFNIESPDTFFIIGCVFMTISIVITQVATYHLLVYILAGVVAILALLIFSMIPGWDLNAVCVGKCGTTYGSSWDADKIKFIPNLGVRLPVLKNAGWDMAAMTDILDTPLDVLHKQNLLAQLLDDDSWRKKAMRSSVTASFSDDGPGVEMPTVVGDQQDERTENDCDQDNEQQPEAETLDSLLKALGLEPLLETLAAAQLDFGTLCSLAEQDAVCCTHELKEAGVTVPGHRAKIIAALLKMKK